MINNYYVDNDKVYTSDTNDNNRVSQLEYQDNIDEVFRLKNNREILEANIAELENNLKTITEKEKYRKFYKRFGIILWFAMIFALGLINLFKIIPFRLIIGMSVAFSGFEWIFISMANADCLSHKKFIKKAKELEVQMNYLEEELAKVKEVEEQAKNTKISKTNDQNYSRDLDSYNEEQKQLLKAKLTLILDYLNNKEKYQAKLQNGELAQNPEEESLIRELIKKEQ